MALNFIDHQDLPALSGQSLDMIDPATGEAFESIARSDARDVDAAVAAAQACRDGVWRRVSAAERGRLLLEWSRAVLAHADELADLEQRDCGKPTAQAQADVQALARYLAFYGGAADKLMGETIPYQDGYSVMTWREAHGVTGHIIPWNYPMQIFGRSVGGALAAGNVCVVKPAEDACLSLIRVAQLAREVGLPAGCLNLVTGLGAEVGEALARHPGVEHISFTGSPRIGTLIQQVAAERHVPVTLELGGKSPQIVFDDADLDAAIPVIVNAIVQNAGQTCSAGSRLLAQRGVYDVLLARLGEVFSKLRSGRPQDDVDVGPLIRAGQLSRVQDFLAQAKADGIGTVAQGRVMDNAPSGGYYQAPVLLRDVPVAHRVAQEEVFGPVLSAMAFDDEDHAIELANATDFGLVAGVWTRDGGRQFRLAKRVRAGQIFVNNYGAGGGVELPFGGVKSSGHGREKGFEALYAFTTLKTVAFRHD